MSPPGRILFIDAYDSFSNNIINLLRSELPVLVEIIQIDDPRFVLNDDAFFNFLESFDAVVAGPGPGHPANPTDAGLISKLWSLCEGRLTPVLGICFGFQSLALHFGATVERLHEPRHRMVASVLHCGRDIFADTGKVVATRYHSLHVQLGHGKYNPNRRRLWTPSRSCRELVPLAWDVGDVVNGEILMAVRHCHKPFWGVQYHPESICTNKKGRKLIANWWYEVLAWQSKHLTKRDSMETSVIPSVGKATTGNGNFNISIENPRRSAVRWRCSKVDNDTTVPQLVNILRTDRFEPLLLESGMRNGKPINEETGRFSIIGVHDAASTHIRYSRSSHELDVVAGDAVLVSRKTTISDVFSFLEAFVKERTAVDGPPKIPFWGGLVGFISYEAGLETIDVVPPRVDEEQSDVWFVFVERSIVVDNVKRKVYVQSIREDDESWLDAIEGKLHEPPNAVHHDRRAIVELNSDTTIASAPQAHKYRQKVRLCQGHLRAGSSYELCLTDTTFLRTKTDPWHLYLRLRDLNPAPFGAYIRLPPTDTSIQGISIISSSPERFLSWSRDGKCQFRPIKGTVKKSPSITRTKAEELLNCPKERAENLMIVDLIRHDLNGVENVRNVRVPKLMSVEEYETVFQLVSVIEGDIDARNSGISVLAASLPPGSMTGAPKRRSCELLKEVENQRPRGLYSGVMGYLDVGGGGDFSVVIRTAFKWDNDAEWRVGAGGAVTAMSDAEAEWQEMVAKRESVLRAFGEEIGA